MFNFSTDSLNDYVFSFPTTPIVLEKVKDERSSFDFIVPTTPSRNQMYSIQNEHFDNDSETETESERETFGHYTNESEFDLPTMQKSSNQTDDSFNNPPKIPFITNIYVASLTVVGLFLLFRMIQK